LTYLLPAREGEELLNREELEPLTVGELVFLREEELIILVEIEVFLVILVKENYLIVEILASVAICAIAFNMKTLAWFIDPSKLVLGNLQFTYIMSKVTKFPIDTFSVIQILLTQLSLEIDNEQVLEFRFILLALLLLFLLLLLFGFDIDKISLDFLIVRIFRL